MKGGSRGGSRRTKKGAREAGREGIEGEELFVMKLGDESSGTRRVMLGKRGGGGREVNVYGTRAGPGSTRHINNVLGT